MKPKNQKSMAQEINQQLQEKLRNKQRIISEMHKSEDLKDVVDILEIFQILWHGWECDEYGYLVQTKSGSLKLAMTSHGGYYLAKQQILQEKVQEYKEVLRQTRQILERLKKQE